ncbi:MAG: sigma-54-dependent Fis family transcriptional regulator [Candidatus Dadabacteria bacterium]|nr:MAG: sigma-54-dependent Fis family transcriptional regulator [Candidatus Dadabacteria bacterium]
MNEKETVILQSDNLEKSSKERLSFLAQTIIGKSLKMREVFSAIEKVSQFDTTVLITGESGTGKELAAKAIHCLSKRKNAPFIAINCGAIPEQLMESELFGHKKGAFTDALRDKKGLFEEASGGTLFLDEIGELPLHLQVKLLRALQEKAIRRVGDEKLIPINVRIIAATLCDLEDEIARGRFRKDLYYRLNIVNIKLPRLRERTEDIPLLCAHFIEKHCKRLGISPKLISSEVMNKLLSYSWPGNVRELENCIERALVLSSADALELSALPKSVLEGGEGEEVDPWGEIIASKNLSIKEGVKRLEIALIKRALDATRGNRTQAAKLLEISHRALLYKIKEYKLGNYGK